MKEGYKKTELGWIPEEWEVKKYSDFARIVRGASPRPKGDPRYYGGNIPRLMIADVTRDGKYVFPKIDFLTEEGAKKSRPMKKGDLVISISGTVALPTFLGVDACIHDGFMGFYDVNECINKEYLYYEILSSRLKLINSATDGGVYVNLTTEIVKEFKTVIPSLKEQEKIAEILSTVDSQIDDTERIIEKTKELKKGLMQQLLTKGIGHSEFKKTEVGYVPKTWNVNKIGDIYGDLKAGATPSRTKPDYFTGNIPWITSGELKKKYVNSTNEEITEDAMKNTNLKLYPQGTFFIAITGLEAEGTRGSCAMNGVPSTTNQSCLAFIEKNQIKNEYLYYWYLLYGNYIGIKYTQGTKQQSLNNKIVEELGIAYPSIEEQERIVSILSSVDNEIDQYENKKIKLEELKKGLMQKLLTGEIRVK